MKVAASIIEHGTGVLSEREKGICKSFLTRSSKERHSRCSPTTPFSLLPRVLCGGALKVPNVDIVVVTVPFAGPGKLFQVERSDFCLCCEAVFD